MVRRLEDHETRSVPTQRGPQRRGELRLSLAAQVAEEDHVHPGALHEQSVRVLVQSRRARPGALRAAGVHHGDAHNAVIQQGPAHAPLVPAHPPFAEREEQLQVPAGRGGLGAVDQFRRMNPVHHRREPAGMIQVRVGQHHEVHAAHSGAPQEGEHALAPRVEAVVRRPAIHQDGRSAARPDHAGVSLAHVNEGDARPDRPSVPRAPARR